MACDSLLTTSLLQVVNRQVQTCYQQAGCKLFQQVVTSLQMTRLKSGLIKLTSLLQLVDKLLWRF